MAKHKHYDCIVAWANGATIQARHNSTEPWRTLLIQPGWLPETEYRVKPEVRQYRVGLMSGPAGYPIAAMDEKHAKDLEKSSVVIRWLTDWIEYEV